MLLFRKIDDKDSYALDRCISAMYGDEKFGIYKYGYEEDVDGITIKEVSDYYNWLIHNSKIDIFISGDIDVNQIEKSLKENENIKKLKPRIENYILNNEFTESKQIVENPNEIFGRTDLQSTKRQEHRGTDCSRKRRTDRADTRRSADVSPAPHHPGQGQAIHHPHQRLAYQPHRIIL